MSLNENINKNDYSVVRKTQEKAAKKAAEHAIGIVEFVGWLFVLNSERVEILVNDEHKLLIINGIRNGQKFIYRYFFFGRDEWESNSEESWKIYKQTYIVQLKRVLPKIKWNENEKDNTLAYIYKKDFVAKLK